MFDSHTNNIIIEKNRQKDKYSVLSYPTAINLENIECAFL